MTSVRMLLRAEGSDAMPRLAALTEAARALPGCLHSEDFVALESDSQFLHVELWETPGAWDAAYAARTEALTALAYRLEFYKFARFAPTGPAWVAVDSDARGETLRWPAAPGPIRILIQVTGNPTDPAQPLVDLSYGTRQEEGCLEFTFFRSVDFPENLALLESWASPAIYDRHWQFRLSQNSPPPPPAPERRYGETTFEWYPECHFILKNGCWVAEEPAKRMDTVFW